MKHSILAVCVVLAACGGGGGGDEALGLDPVDEQLTALCNGPYEKQVHPSSPDLTHIVYDVRCADGRTGIVTFDQNMNRVQ